jgi:hypothetical protein
LDELCGLGRLSKRSKMARRMGACQWRRIRLFMSEHDGSINSEPHCRPKGNEI